MAFIRAASFLGVLVVPITSIAAEPTGQRHGRKQTNNS
jgi:hypothetical protein